jgi:hypothetical protein
LEGEQISRVLTDCLPLTEVAVSPEECEVLNMVRGAEGKPGIAYSWIHLALAHTETFWDGEIGRQIREALTETGFYGVWAALPTESRAEVANTALALAELERRRFIASADFLELKVLNTVRRAEGKPEMTHADCTGAVDAFWESDGGRRLKPLVGTYFWAVWSHIPQHEKCAGMEMIYLAEALHGILLMAEALMPKPARAWIKLPPWEDRYVVRRYNAK